MKKTLALGTAFLAMLSACSPSADTALPQPIEQPVTIDLVNSQRFADIHNALSAALTAADDSLNADNLPTTRLGDPIIAQRTAEYRLKGALGDDYELDPIVLNADATPVVSGNLFPRTIMTLSGPMSGENLSTLSVWQAADARSQYRLVGDIELFPNVDIPAIVSALSEDEGYLGEGTALVAEPTDVLVAYAEYSENREQGSIAFSPDDPLYSQTNSFASSMRNTLGDLGTFAMTYDVPDAPIQAVSTEDGGIIMVGQVRYSIRINKSDPESTLTIGGEIGAWLTGDAESVEVADMLRANYDTQVAFYVPPAGAQDTTVRVIGSSRPILTSVTNPDPDAADDSQ